MSLLLGKIRIFGGKLRRAFRSGHAGHACWSRSLLGSARLARSSLRWTRGSETSPKAHDRPKRSNDGGPPGWGDGRARVPRASEGRSSLSVSRQSITKKSASSQSRPECRIRHRASTMTEHRPWPIVTLLITLVTFLASGKSLLFLHSILGRIERTHARPRVASISGSLDDAPSMMLHRLTREERACILAGVFVSGLESYHIRVVQLQ